MSLLLCNFDLNMISKTKGMISNSIVLHVVVINMSDNVK